MIGRYFKNITPVKLRGWRKVSLGTWKVPADSSVYTHLELDIENALRKLEELKKDNPQVTITHIVAKAIAYAYTEYPQLNRFVRWGRLYQRHSVDLFFQVNVDKKGQELSGKVVRDVHNKSILEVTEDLKSGAKQIRDGKDKFFNKIKKTMSMVPWFLTRPMLKFIEILTCDLNIWSPLLGVKKDAFGSAMITNVAHFNVDMVFAPLVPFSRAPVIYAFNKLKKVPYVDGDEVKIKTVLPVSLSFDHRVMDGKTASFIRLGVDKYLSEL
jgi:pyruvate/2-oxoglutarate dehydrogenase complex dihydrolipoamide acyltransferase (E2) component